MTDSASRVFPVEHASRSDETLPEQSCPNDRTEVFDRCGLVSWRPTCLQRAANIRLFLAAVCFISCLQAAFSGYIASQVTTLEKRFAVGSSVIGAMNSFFEIGYIISVIFVSYAGGRGHVPMWISIGLFVMAAGAFLWSTPHFIFPYKGLVTWSRALVDPLCHLNTSNSVLSQDAECTHEHTSGYAFLPILLLSQLLIGSGSSPILTLAPPFIDDHVHPTKAPPMIASQYAAAAMGPVFGFALGACLLQYPAELFSSTTGQMDDPEWIGAWWVGFILLGVLVLIGALILLLFPKKLHTLSKKPPTKLLPYTPTPTTIQENGSAISATPSIPAVVDASVTTTQSTSALSENRRLTAQSPWSVYSRPRSRSRRSPYSCAPQLRCRLFHSPDKFTRFSDTLRSLLRNRIYLVVSLCICSEMFMIIGFASFLPKYLEMEYHISKSTASLIAGGLIVPAGALGILAGGLILHRSHFRRRGAIRFVLVINFIIIGCISSFFFLGCGNPAIAGITVDYPSTSHSVATTSSLPWWSSSSKQLQPDSQCNAACVCDPNIWAPVCNQAIGISYVSPCFAGCSGSSFIPTSSQQKVYENCSCVFPSVANALDSVSLKLQPSQCPLQCNRLILFVFVLTTCLFLTGVIQNPLLMVTMRSVNHNERSFALGLQFVIIRLLANMPSPMVFGRVIDGACRFWRFDCGRRGDCAFVDVRKLNLYMAGLGVIIKGSGFIFYILLLFLLRSPSPSQGTNELAYLGAVQYLRKPSEPLSGPIEPR
ncbi:solute carrier organic anion transporter family, member 3A [Paragonimus westermani]|uniref:Solute carrier organic anion transporter family member n=1 Tax=Paragonimus westermani TaxID=34504 RepID=A0A5J4NKE7_9TREM|nr:solute carrier organic anion transporter family, member 3A [Paragonimus westermani]